jgi:hypothetical protein
MFLVSYCENEEVAEEELMTPTLYLTFSSIDID